jgi:hypothetical protein
VLKLRIFRASASASAREIVRAPCSWVGRLMTASRC